MIFRCDSEFENETSLSRLNYFWRILTRYEQDVAQSHCLTYSQFCLEVCWIMIELFFNIHITQCLQNFVATHRVLLNLISFLCYNSSVTFVSRGYYHYRVAELCMYTFMYNTISFPFIINCHSTCFDSLVCVRENLTWNIITIYVNLKYKYRIYWSIAN